jgi:glucose/arabinose dehydrogenase/predicted phosphodiesterase
MEGFDKVNYVTVLTPLMILTFSLLFHSFLTGNDRGLGNVFGLNSTNTGDFSFAAVGDWGCSPNTKKMIDNMIDKNPQLILGLGDYSYNHRADCWLKLVDPIYPKMKIAIGNHEYLTYTSTTDYYSSPERLKQYMNHFNLSRQFYSFNNQNVHFIAMSTEIPYEKGSEQYDFVKRDLQKAMSEPGIDWIVVFYHRVAYTSPVYLINDYLREVPSLRETYHPLFEKYGVDLVLQGHSHNYQRTYPIEFNEGDPKKPDITDKDKTNYLNPKGQIFTIVGTGGSSEVHNFKGNPAEFTAAQFNAYGFLDISLLQNGTVLEGSFYENNGTVKDHFTIVKSKNDNKETNSSSSSQSSPLPSSEPKVKAEYSDKFVIRPVVTGLKSASDMAFLGPEEILVLDKRNGIVNRAVNGQLSGQPLLDVNVSNKVERGLVGIAISNATNGTKYVFLYYTEGNHDGEDICPESDYCTPGAEPLGNRLYRYELTNDTAKLINPKLLLDLPATPGPGHNGGKMITDDNKSVYIIVGDIMAEKSMTQNYNDGEVPDGTGGILKVDQDGNFSDGILGSKFPLNAYYAYGIRNGFGLDFDPITGNLWDTENGPEFGDEINLVKPGFNSGWKDIQGVWNHRGGEAVIGPLNLDGLEDFNGKGKYAEPEFTWKETVGPTGIKFFNSDKFGPDYKNDIFVGDVHNGNIYHFNLNDNRTSLLLNGVLSDKIADSTKELDNIVFAEGFGGITDLEIGPDGYLYVLSLGLGTIYKIVPK